jgi:hypothetical protein
MTEFAQVGLCTLFAYHIKFWNIQIFCSAATSLALSEMQIENVILFSVAFPHQKSAWLEAFKLKVLLYSYMQGLVVFSLVSASTNRNGPLHDSLF